MISALVRALFVTIVIDCATAGQALPWPELRDFWRVCSILGIGCTAGVLIGLSRRGHVQPPDGRIALAVAGGFSLRGAINLLVCLTH
jgi:hypothetical protein